MQGTAAITAAAVRGLSPRGFLCVEFADLHAAVRGARLVEERFDHDLPPLRLITRFAAKIFTLAESLQTDFPREVSGAVAVARVLEGWHEEASLAGAGERGEGFRIPCLRAPGNSLSL